ncbi:MAG: hypothetical protein JXR94_17605 [Candidatus Hydrogenedentes bacterium]|nr:hypothetical protein [Candidatus Hydrogenedentota bacterium]
MRRNGMAGRAAAEEAKVLENGDPRAFDTTPGGGVILYDAVPDGQYEIESNQPCKVFGAFPVEG